MEHLLYMKLCAILGMRWVSAFKRYMVYSVVFLSIGV